MPPLSDVLYRTPMTDALGRVTRPWAQWFANLTGTLQGEDMPGGVETLLLQALQGPDIQREEGGASFLPLSVALPNTLREFAMGYIPSPPLEAPEPLPLLVLGAPTAHDLHTGAPPTIVPVAAGAGANATATISGTDTAGTIVLTTHVMDTPSASSDVCETTFSLPYGVPPIVLFMSANDAAWSLMYTATQGLRVRQADVTTTSWKIRSGPAALPALTSAEYRYNYHVLGNTR